MRTKNETSNNSIEELDKLHACTLIPIILFQAAFTMYKLILIKDV